MSYKRWGSLLLGVAGILFLLCPALALAGQKELAASIAETRIELMNTKEQLKSAMEALNNLQESADLNKAYDTFVSSLAQVKGTETAIQARALAMQENAAGHFESWQKDIDAINNSELRAASGKRLIKVKKVYDTAVDKIKNATALYKPSISDLSDISTVLSNDLTANGVKSISSVIRQARASLRAVSSAIEDTMQQMELVEKTLSSN